MNIIPLDAIIYIASFNELSWYKITQINEEFSKYSKTDDGIKKFISLFYKSLIEDKNIVWRILSIIHSFDDKPAIIRADGMQAWYINGKLHRDGDKPACIWANGAQVWYINGNRHRDGDKPACIWVDGSQEWYINGIKIIQLNHHLS